MVEHINEELHEVKMKRDSVSKLNYFIGGTKSGIPISIGYIPIAITFALISKSSDIPNLISICMSLFIYAGASQFIGVNLMAIGASTLEIVLTTFILNFRHFLMSSSLSQRITENTSKKLLGILAYGITDETFAVASLREEKKINPWFILGLNIIAFTSWNFGTCIGLLLGDILPKTLKSSMGIALYSMFIGLLVPALKSSRSIVIVSVLSITISSLLHWVPIFLYISTGWCIIISTVVSSAIGALLYPMKEE